MNHVASSSSLLSSASSPSSPSSQEWASRTEVLPPPPPFACPPPHLTPLLGQIRLEPKLAEGAGSKKQDREPLCDDSSRPSSPGLGKWTLPEEALLFDPFADGGEGVQAAAEALSSVSSLSSPASGGIGGEGREPGPASERLIFGNSPISEVEQAAIDKVVAELEKAPGRLTASKDGEGNQADGHRMWIEQLILRFLYSSGFDVNKTLDLMQSTLVFRMQHLPVYMHEVLPQIRDQGVAYWHGRDKCLRPLLIICVDKMQRVQQQSGRDIEEDPVTRALIFCLEFFLRHLCVAGRVESWSILCDCKGTSFSAFPVALLLRLLTLLQSTYRGRMYRFYLLNTPRFFHMVSRPLLAALPASSAKKLRIFRSFDAWTEERKATFACHQLEVKYGGTQPNVEKDWFPFRFFPGPFDPNTSEAEIRWHSPPFLHEEAPPSVHTGFSLHSSLSPHSVSPPSPCGSTATSTPTCSGEARRPLPASPAESPEPVSSAFPTSRSSFVSGTSPRRSGVLSGKGGDRVRPARFAYWAPSIRFLSLPSTTAEWLNRKFCKFEEQQGAAGQPSRLLPRAASASPSETSPGELHRSPSVTESPVSPQALVSPASALSASPGSRAALLSRPPSDTSPSRSASLRTSEVCFSPTTSMEEVRERWAAEKAAAYQEEREGPQRMSLAEICEGDLSGLDRELQGDGDPEDAEESENSEHVGTACDAAVAEQPSECLGSERCSEEKTDTRQEVDAGRHGEGEEGKPLGWRVREAGESPTVEMERGDAGLWGERGTEGREEEISKSRKTVYGAETVFPAEPAAKSGENVCSVNERFRKDSETSLPAGLSGDAVEHATLDRERFAAVPPEGMPRKRRGERFKRRKKRVKDDEPTLSLSASSSLAFVLWKRRVRHSGEATPGFSKERLGGLRVCTIERLAEEGLSEAKQQPRKGRRRLRPRAKNSTLSSAPLASRSVSSISKRHAKALHEETRVSSAPAALAEDCRGQETPCRWRSGWRAREDEDSGSSASRRLLGAREGEKEKRELEEAIPAQVFSQLSADAQETGVYTGVSPSISSVRRFAAISGAVTRRAATAPWRALRLGRWRLQFAEKENRGDTQLDSLEEAYDELRHPGEASRPRSWTKGDCLWALPAHARRLCGGTSPEARGATGDIGGRCVSEGVARREEVGRGERAPDSRRRSFQGLSPGSSASLSALPPGAGVSEFALSPRVRPERLPEAVGGCRRRRFLSRRSSRGRGLKEKRESAGERPVPVVQSFGGRSRRWLRKQRSLDSHRGPQLCKASSTPKPGAHGMLSSHASSLSFAARAGDGLAASRSLSRKQFNAETAAAVAFGASSRRLTVGGQDMAATARLDEGCHPAPCGSESACRGGKFARGGHHGAGRSPSRGEGKGACDPAPSLPGRLSPFSRSLNDVSPACSAATALADSPPGGGRGGKKSRERTEKEGAADDTQALLEDLSPPSPSQNAPLKEAAVQNNPGLSEGRTAARALEAAEGPSTGNVGSEFFEREALFSRQSGSSEQSPSSSHDVPAKETLSLDRGAGSVGRERQSANMEVDTESVDAKLKSGKNSSLPALSSTLKSSVQGPLSPLREDVAREGVETPQSENGTSVEVVSFAVRSEVDSQVVCSDSQEQTEEEAADASDERDRLPPRDLKVEEEETIFRVEAAPESRFEKTVEKDVRTPKGGPGVAAPKPLYATAAFRGAEKDSREFQGPTGLAALALRNGKDSQVANTHLEATNNNLVSGSAPGSASAEASISSASSACSRPRLTQTEGNGGDAVASTDAPEAAENWGRGGIREGGPQWTAGERGTVLRDKKVNRSLDPKAEQDREGTEEHDGSRSAGRGEGLCSAKSDCESLSEKRADESKEGKWTEGEEGREGWKETGDVGPIRKARGKRQRLKKTLVACLWKARETSEPGTLFDDGSGEESDNAVLEPPSAEACVTAKTPGPQQ
ncbi:CRAL/TRIO domain protein [Toxoplasma gondii ARI]|uniref:CRAL/TRIO domain protein n=1 Tax=Toxoplasma gondii ARI TaxID=1074872 RepID=A0A139XZI7_TOXGO|nr:CRAL/TRIO domain protein [Toxoplasma gondii ARI]